MIVSINAPINNPTIGPKYQPMIIPGNQANEIVMPAVILILKRLRRILNPSRAAKTQMPVIDLKIFTGQNGNKNLINLFVFWCSIYLNHSSSNATKW